MVNVSKNPTIADITSSDNNQRALLPENELFQRIQTVCKYAFIEMQKYPITTALMATAVPFSIAMGYYALLILPIGYIAAVILFELKQFQEESAVIKFFEGIHTKFNEQKFITKIEECETIRDLRSNLANTVGKIKGWNTYISTILHPSISLFSDVFKPNEQLESHFRSILNKTDEGTLANYKNDAIGLITTMKDSLDDAVSNKLPAYIKSLHISSIG
jgi:hypothetical protein